ncbi:hypothetical protein CGLO_06933 [Colletotrichum gloeosporioides Cg-14]|uniref:Uncharacterized protein n=1 Tax=Colletotrichum gloeosporioides (strain Cg-14) TaxID=1237896 RepID=T0KMU5_COLGC|nr:hypothetical protein CGLO_06933 [Colletotrichum gloeosporioides Cg-14]
MPARTRLPVLVMLLCLESVVVFVALALFGIAYPDRFRSRLWRNGGEEGWCSNPRLRIYFYANYEEPPEIPLIWSQRLTTSNAATAVLSLAVLFVRITIAALHYDARWTNTAYDAVLAGLWAWSAAAQGGADLTDPEHLMPRPWYLVRGCEKAWRGNRTWCRVAKWEYGIFYIAKIVGTAGWMVYEKGKRDASREEDLTKIWRREGGGSYKDDADCCSGHDSVELTSYRS